ncbi:hypothetical protein AB0F20_26330 [Streptomyces goshikiensis]
MTQARGGLSLVSYGLGARAVDVVTRPMAAVSGQSYISKGLELSQL